MYERHQKLKNSRTGTVDLESELDQLQQRLNQERQKNARIEQDVKNFEERQVILEEIEKLKAKLAWLVSFL